MKYIHSTALAGLILATSTAFAGTPESRPFAIERSLESLRNTAYGIWENLIAAFSVLAPGCSNCATGAEAGITHEHSSRKEKGSRTFESENISISIQHVGRAKKDHTREVSLSRKSGDAFSFRDLLSGSDRTMYSVLVDYLASANPETDSVKGIQIKFPGLIFSDLDKDAHFRIIFDHEFTGIADFTRFNSSFARNNSLFGVSHFHSPSGTLLSVPLPKESEKYNSYGEHIANFCKHNREEAVELLLQTFSSALAKITGQQDTRYYISTHGHGVPWVHFRTEETPRYHRSMEKFPNYLP